MFRKAGPGRHFLHCRSNLRNLDRAKQMIHPAEIRGQIFAAENDRAGLSPDGKIVQLKRSGPIPAVVFDLRVAVRLVGAGAVEGVDHPDKTLHDPVDRKPVGRIQTFLRRNFDLFVCRIEKTFLPDYIGGREVEYADLVRGRLPRIQSDGGGKAQ